MQSYLQSPQEVFDAVQSSQQGLSRAEAEKRLAENGENKLQEGKKKSLARRFLEQFADPMIIILIAAAVVSGITAAMESEFPTDVIIILAVVLINAVLGVYQESKAEKAIEALQKMAAATSKVLRNGEVKQIPSAQLVVGDVILLEAGDAVPADARIFECASLKIEEAALTGESVPVNKAISALGLGDQKDVPLGDRKNMMYMGSSVVYGRGRAVVTATGMDTEMGKIAGALSAAQESRTPLQLKLAQLSKILSYIVLGICVFMFVFDIVRRYATGGVPDFDFLLNSFMIAVSLAVAAIPEGLAAVVTVVLSIGVTNMSKKNAIIRKLTAVETLGCAQIICSDKTGTLTQNKMTVVEHYGEDEKLLAQCMALCTDVSVDHDGNLVGEPTEAALVAYAMTLGLNKNDMLATAPRVGEAPFDSSRKMMSTIHKTADGVLQFTKGAPDVVLGHCTHIFKNGESVPMTEADREAVLAANKAFADRALRVLAGAFRTHAAVPDDQSPEAIEHDLTFVGLTGMIDPVRPEVKAAIEECRSAGIRPIMITGDHKDTAVAIAKELGIIEDASQAITGAELNDISDEEFKEKVTQYSVYARVQPEHKVRIVNAWRARGMVTAMTGDGVNDAPALKAADVGVAMGINGTEVSKSAAKMILTDDKFSTIIEAVAEGRNIFSNIRKLVYFLLVCNISEIAAMLFAQFMGWELPLTPLMLLIINVLGDGIPGLALSKEESDKRIMKRKPIGRHESFFGGGLMEVIIQQICVFAIVTLAGYYIGMHVSFEGSSPSLGAGRTMAFLITGWTSILHVLTVRSRSMLYKYRVKDNPQLYISCGVMIVVFALVAAIPPIASALELGALGWQQWLIVVGLSLVPMLVAEYGKLWDAIKSRNTERTRV